MMGDFILSVFMPLIHAGYKKNNHFFAIMAPITIPMIATTLKLSNLSKEKLAQTSDYFLCKTKCTLHEKPLLSLSTAALIGVVIGAVIAKKVIIFPSSRMD